MLPQAPVLVAAGMATVFVLLAALIAAIAVMSRLIGPRQPEQPAEAPREADAQAEMAAAVAAAIRHHRGRMAVVGATGS